MSKVADETEKAADTLDLEQLAPVIRDVKRLAIEYRRLTGGRPLGITGEVAEYEAARLLRLELAAVRQSGFDATSDGTRFQIKGRCILEDAKPGQRLGGIKLEKEWDAVLLVMVASADQIRLVQVALLDQDVGDLHAVGGPPSLLPDTRQERQIYPTKTTISIHWEKRVFLAISN